MMPMIRRMLLTVTFARTNFSFAGEVNRGAGYVRYMEADRVLMKASATGGVTPQGIFNDLSRSFRNCMLDIDLRSGKFNRPQGSGWFVDQDFIPRNSTSCSIVVQGVKPGEKAELTTMWTMLGYPSTGIAVPLWVKDADKFLPSMVCWGEACAPLRSVIGHSGFPIMSSVTIGDGNQSLSELGKTVQYGE